MSLIEERAQQYRADLEELGHSATPECTPEQLRAVQEGLGGSVANLAADIALESIPQRKTVATLLAGLDIFTVAATATAGADTLPPAPAHIKTALSLHKSAMTMNEGTVTITVPEGTTEDGLSEDFANETGISQPQAMRALEQANGSRDPLMYGREINAPRVLAHYHIGEKDVVVPLGSNLTEVAAQNNLTLTQLENLDPQYRRNPDEVQDGAKMVVGFYESSPEKLVTKPHPRHEHHPPTTTINKSKATPTPPAMKPVAPDKLRKPAAAPVAPHKTVKAPASHSQEEAVGKAKRAVKPHAQTTSSIHHKVLSNKSGPGIGGALGDDIKRTLNRAEASLAQTSKDLVAEQETADRVKSMARRLMQGIIFLDGKSHHQVHKYKANSNICSSTGHMFGKNNEQIATNYFVICQGDSVAQAAGVVGNLMQESSLQPEEIENGGYSKDPATAGSGGWGIAQWTPGSKASSESRKYGIKGLIYTLQAQLTLVSAEMKGRSPTGERNMVRGLKQVKDPSVAAERFEQNFEEGPIAAQGGGQLSNRQYYARAAAHKYGAGALEALRSLHDTSNHTGGVHQAHWHSKRHDKPTTNWLQSLAHIWGATNGSRMPSVGSPHTTTSKSHSYHNWGNNHSYLSGTARHSETKVKVVWPFTTKNPHQYRRDDQGWDLKSYPGAAVRAIAPGWIYKFKRNPGAFGNDYPTEKLDKSIGGPTKWLYDGHVHVDKRVIGKHVNAGQIIAFTNKHDPQNGSSAPAGWLEIGFARPKTDAPVQKPTSANEPATWAGKKIHAILRDAPAVRTAEHKYSK
jgi:hypothetical protein